MPLSSQMHVPQLVGEDDKYIRYGCDADLYETGTEESKTVDGVEITLAKRRDGAGMGLFRCVFAKPDFDANKAQAWFSAQKFSVEPTKLFSISNVEIFSEGLWNGRQIKQDDLKAIVDAFSATKGMVRPFLKLGHDEEQKMLQEDGLPAAGWVENLRHVGSKIVADFVDVPKKIYQLIKNKAYRKVSCEIYNNLKIDGKTYPKMLGAVALLGSDMPGVLNLNDILAMYSSHQNFSSMMKFASEKPGDIISMTTKKTSEGQKMEELEVYKQKLEAAEKATSDKDREIERYKKEAEDAKGLLLEAARKDRETKIDLFVAELQSDKLCTKAMSTIVKDILTEDKETYSVGDKQMSKSDAIKCLLQLSKEASKVNFSETTKDEKTSNHADLNAVVEKYATEHKLSYGAAYRAVTRGVDIPSKPLS